MAGRTKLSRRSGPHMRTITTISLTAGFLTAIAFLQSCGGSEPSAADKYRIPDAAGATAPTEGKKADMVAAADITLGEVDHMMAEKGKTTYDVKCQACHSTGENRIVGPGWKGITTRRQPEWIMNMIMNTDAMLSEDPEAQKMLEQCLVRMPNQNLTKDDARQLLEFMRTL